MKISPCLTVLFAVMLSGCAISHPPAGAPVAAQTRETQSATTPTQALALLQAGNDRFVSGRTLHRDLRQQVRQTSAGQFPFAAIVNCLDSRDPAELIFDQGIGDIFNARIAGNVIDDDILGSLEFATRLSGAKLIVVIGHTSCGAIKGACDGAQLGHLTGLLERIKPAIDSVQTAPGAARTSKNTAFVEDVATANVRLALKTIRAESPILRELIEQGRVGLVGGMYDLETGKVTFFSEQNP